MKASEVIDRDYDLKRTLFTLIYLGHCRTSGSEGCENIDHMLRTSYRRAPIIELLERKLEWSGIPYRAELEVLYMIQVCCPNPGYAQLILCDIIETHHKTRNSDDKSVHRINMTDFVNTFYADFPVIYDSIDELTDDFGVKYSNKFDEFKIHNRVHFLDPTNQVDTVEFWQDRFGKEDTTND